VRAAATAVDVGQLSKGSPAKAVWLCLSGLLLL